MAYYSFRNDNNGASQFALVQFRKSNAFASVAANDVLGQILFSGYDALTTTYKTAGFIYCQATGAPSTNVPSELQFYSANGTSSHLAMTVGENGQVSIANPATNQASLVVRNDQSTPNINLRTANATASNAPHVHFTRSRAGTADVVANDELGRFEFLGFQSGTAREAGEITAVAESVNGTTGVSSYLSFRTVPTTYAAMAERMRISADGLVSVLTPAAAGTALTVNGVNSIANYSLTTTASVSAALHNAAKFENANTTAGSGCQLSIDVQNQSGVSGGDSSLRFLNTGIRAIALGIDSSTDQFVMANSSSPGTANFFSYTASNSQINKPLQCAFHAYVSTIINNVTGNNTNYQIVFNTETFDQNNNYNNATGLFTAPQTGKYLFTYSIYLLGLVNHAQYFTQLVTTSITYTLSDLSPFTSILTNANQLGYPPASLCVSMTAGDTAFIRINVNGGTNTQVVDVFGAVGDARTNFSGFLVC